MPEIQAFRGWRYDLGHVGSLSDVVAPPYDVITPEMQDALYKRHPANVVRLELNREEPGDDQASNRYTRAAAFLRNWRSEGVLVDDPEPALYVYHQLFRQGDETYTRRGFLCRVRLERFGQGRIHPHEETHSGPKADRLKLFHATKANVSPIFALYPDEENEAQNLLESRVQGATPLEAEDHLGVVHRLWPVTDLETITRLAGIVGPLPAYIADGHHRYETSCDYRDELAAGGQLDPAHPANYVMMMLVGMSDPGMIVLPTHRLFRGVPELSSEQLIERLRGCFITRIAGEGSDLAPAIWEKIRSAGHQGTLGLYTAQDERWVIAEATDDALERMAEVAPDHSRAWHALGVSLLHRLVVETLLGQKDLPSPKYVRKIEELVQGLDEGDRAGRDETGQIGQEGAFNLAAIVMPATLEHIRQLSDTGERMPAKSTYFYPKLLTGLVIHPL